MNNNEENNIIESIIQKKIVLRITDSDRYNKDVCRNNMVNPGTAVSVEDNGDHVAIDVKACDKKGFEYLKSLNPNSVFVPYTNVHLLRKKPRRTGKKNER
jgi:hypothetical protein